MTQAPQEHWQQVYATKAVDQVSWFEPVPGSSLQMIEELGLPADAAIIDVGGGASRLAQELVARGHTDLTVCDISGESLKKAPKDFPDAGQVTWIEADVRDHDFDRRYAVWHDRAVFHFMVSAVDRIAYLATLRGSLSPGGHLILAAFGPEGPERCSGLPVHRYSAEELASAVGDIAELESAHTEDHVTPSGSTQQFLFAHFIANRESV
jgi:ubiquinone/menaquinone biosynthesis C-methylase UbiE